MQGLRFKKHDGGRADAGFKGSAGDCVTRSIAIALQLPYRKTYTELGELMGEMSMGLETTPRNGVYAPVYCAYLTQRGWKLQITKDAYLDDIPRKGTYIANCKNHLVCVTDGVVLDAWDSRKCNRTKSGSPTMKGYFFKEAKQCN